MAENIIKNGGPAFPVMESNGEGRLFLCSEGMSLRDYFAAKAMQGLMGRNWAHMEGQDSAIIKTWVVSSYAIADAMLAEREKGGAA